MSMGRGLAFATLKDAGTPLGKWRSIWARGQCPLPMSVL